MQEAVRDNNLAPDAHSGHGFAVLAWVLLFLASASLLQFFIPYPVDDDTAYHFAVAQLIRQHGILHAFPWTPFSWLADHYADKEFFFHLLFVPFTGLGFVTAARVVGTIAGTAVLTTLYLILRAERVAFAGVWALLPLACSEFVFRLALVRPHLLSITLALVVMWAVVRERLVVLAVVSAVYPLSYVAFWQVPLIALVAAEAARFAAGERLRWKPACTVLCGIVAGVLLHPNTVNLVKLNWIHMSDVLFRNAWEQNVGFSLGKELNPLPLADWGRHMAVTVVLAGSALVLGWRDRRKSFVLLAFALAAAVFGVLAAKSLRFIEYFVPFSVAALAISSRAMRRRSLAPILLGISAVYAIALGTEPYRVLASKKPYFEPTVAAYLGSVIPTGSQVFTVNWDYTGNLMLALPERRFIVAADPTLFYEQDPKLYNLWFQMPIVAPMDSADEIRRLFKGRFVISRNHPAYWRFFDTLSSDPQARLLFTSDDWVVFALGETPR